jgi:hypothetical protein
LCWCQRLHEKIGNKQIGEEAGAVGNLIEQREGVAVYKLGEKGRIGSVVQDVDDLLEGFSVDVDQQKAAGVTGQAV